MNERDIVAVVRRCYSQQCEPVPHEAADEIERLRQREADLIEALRQREDQLRIALDNNRSDNS